MIALMLIVVLAVGPDGEIQITRNFAAEHNKVVEAIPEADRAWPLYVRALSTIKPWNAENVAEKPPLDVQPGNADWPRIEAWLKDNEEAIGLIEQAALRPVVGARWSDAADPELAKALHTPPEKGSDNPELGEILLPHVGPARRFALLMRLEVRRRAAAGDAVGAVRGLSTIAGLAKQLVPDPSLVGQLVGYVLFTHGCDEIDQTVLRYPDLLSANQLDQLSQQLTSAAGTRVFEPDLSFQRDSLLDILQRTYTDDGHGDGHMTKEGAKRFTAMAGKVVSLQPDGTTQQAMKDSPSTRDALVANSAPRAEVLREYDQWLALAGAAIKQPLWQIDREPLNAQTKKLTTNALRYAPTGFAMPAIDKAYLAFWQARQRLEGEQAVLAIMAFRVKTDRFPTSLDECFGPADKPKDVFTGQPLIYRLHEGKPLLYSRGVNQTDDGGVNRNSPYPAKPWMSLPPEQRPMGDWVLFPPQEIEKR